MRNIQKKIPDLPDGLGKPNRNVSIERLDRCLRSGVTLLFGNLTGLKKDQSGNKSGNLMLPAGTYTLLNKTDHADKVDESNEGNNLAHIMVTVKGECGSDEPLRSEK